MEIILRPHNAYSVKGSKRINTSAVEGNVIDCRVRSNILGHWVLKTLFTVCVSTSNDSIDVKEAFMHHQNTYKLVMIHLTQHLNTSFTDQCRSVMYLFFWGCTSGSSLGALGKIRCEQRIKLFLWMVMVHCHFLPCFYHLFSTMCLLFITFKCLLWIDLVLPLSQAQHFIIKIWKFIIKIWIIIVLKMQLS